MEELCELCGTGPYKNLAAHERGPKHQAKLAEGNVEPTLGPEPEPEVKPGLDVGLQAIVDNTAASPQERAHEARVVFSANGWPNKEHPGTVRDFLLEYEIPIIGG